MTDKLVWRVDRRRLLKVRSNITSFLSLVVFTTDAFSSLPNITRTSQAEFHICYRSASLWYVWLNCDYIQLGFFLCWVFYLCFESLCENSRNSGRERNHISTARTFNTSDECKNVISFPPWISIIFTQAFKAEWNRFLWKDNLLLVLLL